VNPFPNAPRGLCYTNWEMNEQKEKPKLTFFILTRHSKDLVRDFQQFLANIKISLGLDIIQTSPTVAKTSNNLGFSAGLALITEGNQFVDQGFPFCVKLIISAEDEATFRSIRITANNINKNYQFFSEEHQAFIPQDPQLQVDTVGEYNTETNRILNKFGLTPVYFYQPTRTYYAQDADGRMVIINRALLEFIYEKEIPEKELPELSYEVAPSIQDFGYMFDRRLIPLNFYEYYQKPHKIINRSFFDIDNPGRKVFIKPYIFELKQETNEFYTQAGEGSSLLFMDKIRPGETLDQTIKRILSEDLKIAEDYLGAFVAEDVGFDRDKEGVLTPRLIVFIYVEKIKNREWALKMSQTSWRSLDGSLASQPQS